MYETFELNVYARMMLPDGEQADENEDPDCVLEEDFDTLDEAVARAREITAEEALRYQDDYGKNGLDVFVCDYAFQDDGEQVPEFDVPYEASWYRGTFFDDPTFEPAGRDER